jgi:hypothetical protein
MVIHSQSISANETEDHAIAKLFEDAQIVRECASAALRALGGLTGELHTVYVLKDNVDTQDWFLCVEMAGVQTHIVQISDDHEMATVYEKRASFHRKPLAAG